MKKIVVGFIAILVSLLVLTIGVVYIYSPKTTATFLDEDGNALPGSIAEIRDVMIGGVQQRLLIRGKNTSNPLLLHLHGGPGGPDQAIIQSTGKTVEDLFTVVYWDQRGAGGSNSESALAQSLSLQQITDDGIELTQKLLTQFGQEKLYLQGHSWGSLLGIHMVTAAPDLFFAYLGIGQFAVGKRSEKLSWEYAVAAAKNAGDDATLEQLKALGSPPYTSDQEWLNNVVAQRQLLIPYENPNSAPAFTMHDFYKIFSLYEGYTVSEKLGMLSSPYISMQQLWPSVIESNLIESHATIKVPVYIFQGQYDQHTVTRVAKEYFDVIQAPTKRYYSFSNSAHWPHISEHEKYRRHVREILTRASLTHSE